MATVYKRGSCVLLRPKGIKRFQKYSDAHIQPFCSRWKITQTRVNFLLYTAARSTICRRHTTQSVRSTFHSLNLTGVTGPSEGTIISVLRNHERGDTFLKQTNTPPPCLNEAEKHMLRYKQWLSPCFLVLPRILWRRTTIEETQVRKIGVKLGTEFDQFEIRGTLSSSPSSTFTPRQCFAI